MAGIVSKFGRPITAARAQNKPQRIRQGGGGLAAQSQIAAPPAPFQNRLGAANFQRNRTNQNFASDQVQGTPAAGVRPRSPHVTAPRSQPMSHQEVIRGAGYSRKPGLANYSVHDPAYQSQQFGTSAPRGRQAAEVTRGRNTTGRKRLVAPMTDQDFAEGAKLYHREHGSL
jgi:hypothetical protein